MNDFDLTTALRQAARAKRSLRRLTGVVKQDALLAMAAALRERGDTVLEANTIDLEHVRGQKLAQWVVDGMKLTPERLEIAAQQLVALADLPDPVEAVDGNWKYDSGVSLARYRVPLGVVGLAYEVYPEIAVGGMGMALKSGNGIVVAGSQALMATQEELSNLLSGAAYAAGITEGAIQSVPGDRPEGLQSLLRQPRFIDLMVLCGRSTWVERMHEQSSVPTVAAPLARGYVYIAPSASWELVQAIAIEGCFGAGSQSRELHQIYQRPLLGISVHEDWAQQHLSGLVDVLEVNGFRLGGDERARQICPRLQPITTEEDESNVGGEPGSELLELPIYIVGSAQEAIAWLDKHSFGQLEAIVSDSATDIEQFIRMVDASAIYVNSYPNLGNPSNSQLGAFLGISTSKLPARGPISLEDLTTVKYVSWGNSLNATFKA